MKHIFQFLCIILACAALFSLTACFYTQHDKSVVITLDGYKVKYDEYAHYYYAALKIADRLNESEIDGRETNIIAHEMAIEELRRERAILALAKEYSLTLTSADKKEIKAQLGAEIDYLGGRDKWVEFISYDFHTPYSYREWLSLRFLEEKLYAHISEYGVVYSESDLRAAASADVFRYWTQCFIPFKDNRALAESKLSSAMAEFQADKEDFTAIAHRYGSNYEIYSGEYIYNAVKQIDATSSISPLFYKAMKELAVGAYSVVIESDYGFHILYRYEITDGVITDHIGDFSLALTANRYNDTLDKKGELFVLTVKKENLIYGK